MEYPNDIGVEVSVETATALIMAANGPNTGLTYTEAEWPEEEFEKLLEEKRKGDSNN